VIKLIVAASGLANGVFLWALLAAASSLVSDEIRGWLERLPGAILRMAAMRLDPTCRIAVYRDEWLPDLLFITRADSGRPITRLLKATCYSLGHLWSARRQARHLRRAQQHELAAAESAAESLQGELHFYVEKANLRTTGKFDLDDEALGHWNMPRHLYVRNPARARL
jgi:hypothetical protein